MTKPDYLVVLDLLKSRDGMATDILLENGRIVRSYNIASGFDLGDPVPHVTTNISPPNAELSPDFFLANEVVRLVDPENGAVWFERITSTR